MESFSNDAVSGKFGTISAQELTEKLLNRMREHTEQVSLSFESKVLQHETAVSYLKKHGNHQPFETLGIDIAILNEFRDNSKSVVLILP